ncbi:MAG: hypothetical protein K8T20_02995 [Planctomycetes bacterium]|nr:hypothetical protein [Planctomycetota bacterium]
MLTRICLALALCAVPAFAGGIFDLDGKSIDDYLIKVEGRAWLARLEGSAEVGTEDIDGSKIDWHDDLDLGNDKIAVEGLAQVRFKRLRVEARYFQQEYESSQVVSDSFTYNGTKYNTFDDVDSEVTVRSGGVDAEFMLIDVGEAKKAGFRLGLGVGGRYLYAEGAVKKDPNGPRERVDSDTVIPVARASASFGFLNCISLEADAEAMYIRYREIRTGFLDATVQAKFYLFQNVAIGAGYRYIGIDLEDRRGDDHFDIEMAVQGFFAEVTIQF